MKRTLITMLCSIFSVKWSKAKPRPDVQNKLSSVVKRVMIYVLKSEKQKSPQHQMRAQICSKYSGAQLVCLHYLALTWTFLINSTRVTKKVTHADNATTHML